MLLAERPLTIIVLAITGIAGMGSTVFLALSRSTSVDVSIIMNSNAIFIIPLATLIGERFTFRNGVGVIIGLLGCALIINGGFRGFQLVVTSLNMVVGSVPLFFLVMGLGELAIPPLKASLVILYLAVVPTALGFVLWYKALEELDASQLGPLQYLVPIGTATIAIFFLDESIQLASIFGMLLIFLGIYLSTIASNPSYQE